MKWFYKGLTFLLIFNLVGCAGNQGGTDLGQNDRNQELMQATDRNQNQNQNQHQVQQQDIGNRNFTTNREQNQNKNYGVNNRAVADDNGLSKEYHGHISNRPEVKKEKKQPPAANNRFKQVQLLGINDLHGQLNVTRRVGGRPVGRVDYLATYLKEREAENAKNTLYVHAGDMIGASPPVSALLQDEPTIEFLNKMGVDIGTVGNHEFDEGVGELLRLVNGGTHEKTGDFAGADFPWLAANVINEKTGKPILPPHKVLRVNGMPIGFIGVVTTITPSIVVPSGVAGLKFIDEIEAINKSVAELKKQGVRSIVVLTHNPGTSGINGENPIISTSSSTPLAIESS